MMRSLLVALWLGLAAVGDASAEVSIGIQLPGVSIGINVPVYPQLAPVPGYPVYYAPGIEGNFFFYDGLYWVYDDDRWYASSWYNGPWRFVEPAFVPLFVLRVPVRYYRRPPPYFAGWHRDAPPRWGEHWGHDWEAQRHGWNRWNRAAVPHRAPLPSYQRQYSGDRYPHGDEQRALRDRHYHYEPRDSAVRSQYHGDAGHPGAAQRPPRDEHDRHGAPAAAPRGDRPPPADRASSARRGGAAPADRPHTAPPAQAQHHGAAERQAQSQRPAVTNRESEPRAPGDEHRARSPSSGPQGQPRAEHDRPRSEPSTAHEQQPHGGRGPDHPADDRGH